MIMKFIDIADKLFKLQNFNGLNYVLSGLGNNAVHRLRKTWEFVSDADKARLAELKEIMAHPYNMYRKVLSKVVPPCCPFLGVALTDFIFIDEVSDYLLPNDVRKVKLINMRKRNMFVRGIEQIKQQQQKPYEFRMIPFLIKTFTLDILHDSMDSDEAWDRSVVLEPPPAEIPML